MRILFLLLVLLVFTCLPLLAVALTPERVNEYTIQLQSNDQAVCHQAAVKLAMDNQVDILLAALKSTTIPCRSSIVYGVQYCLTPTVLDTLIDIIKKDPDAQLRDAALSITRSAYDREELKDKQSAILETWKAATNDTDGSVGRDAVTAIVHAQPDNADILLDVLANGRTGMARSQAAGLMAYTKDPRVYDALRKTVNDKDVDTSSRAISALGDLGDKRAAPLLMQVIQDDTRYPQLRTNAGHALAMLAAPEVLEKLIELVKIGKPSVREYALTALSGYTDSRLGPMMIPLLADPSESVRITAVRMIGRIKYLPAADALLDQVQKEMSMPVRRELLRTLTLLAEPRAREIFAAALSDPDLQIQQAGIDGLLAIRDDHTLTMLTSMLQSQSVPERRKAISLISETSSPLVIEPLLQYFQRKREEQPTAVWDRADDTAISNLTGAYGNSMTVIDGMNYTSPVTIGIKPLDSNAFPSGEVVDAIFTLYNRSKQAVVVLDFCPTMHDDTDAIVLTSAVYGEITEQDGGYVYNGMPQQASRIPLHAGLLLPGQAMQVRAKYRGVSVTERFLVRFLASAQPYDGTPVSLAPLTIYIPNTEQANKALTRTFIPFTDANWRTVCKTMPVAFPTGPDAAARAVIVTVPADVKPQEEPMMSSTSLVNVKIVFPYLDRARRAAVRISGTPMNDLKLAYSKALDGYLVIDNTGRWLLTDVTQQVKGKDLPVFPESLLKDIDMGEIRVQIDQEQPKDIPANEKFWDTYPVEKGDDMYTRGKFITLDAASLPAFLDALLAHNATLGLHEYFFRSRYYVLNM